MDYSFNAEIAKAYGVNEAVFIHNLYWWIRKNEANGRHYYEGRNWTYNTMDAFSQLFPFWTKDQIRHIILKLKNNGAIYIGNFNKQGFDRTQWYALGEDILQVYENPKCKWEKSHMEVGEFPHGSGENPTPIPDSKPNSKPDSKQEGASPPKQTFEKPTLDEVIAYCRERNRGVDPEKWYDHYTSNGWYVGKVKMKDWKAAVRTWEKPTEQKENKWNVLC